MPRLPSGPASERTGSLRPIELAAAIRDAVARTAEAGPCTIPAAEASSLCPLEDAVEVVRAGLLWEASGRILMPEDRRSTLAVEPPGARPVVVTAKCCAIPELDIAGFRFVASAGSRDPVRLVALASLSDGRLLAFVDEHETYLRRIAALAAVAASHVLQAKPAGIGVIGAGRIARAVTEALLACQIAREVHVTSRQAESRRRLVERLRESASVPIRALDTAQEVAAASDLVVTATSATAPVMVASWLKRGSAVYALGDAQELPEDLLVRAQRGAVRLIVSSWQECLQRRDFRRLIELGRFSRDDIDAELWELVAGRKPARTHVEEIVCVRAPGSVALDVLVAAWVYCQHQTRARQQQITS